MPVIHLQKDSVQSSAQRLRQSSSLLGELVGELLSSSRRLDSAWQGGDKDVFSSEMASLLRNLDARQEELAALVSRLEREIIEWEETDQRGAAGWRGPSSGGLEIPGSALGLAASISAVSLLPGLPAWLSAFLQRFFPQSPVVSPVVDNNPVTRPDASAPIPAPRNKFGDLLEKAEKERKAEEEKKRQEAPRPAHINDYPAREDDGTFLSGQDKNDSCSIASTRMALQRATGVDAKESDLRSASSKLEGGYSGDKKGGWGTTPTSLDDLVNNQYGNVASATYNLPDTQKISDLETAANSGQGIVVSVRNSEWFGSANSHSVTVVGVKTENGQQVVLVNDPWPPGTGKRISVPVDVFEKAWWHDAMYVSKKVQE
jgi:uncharacterized protein YukE